MFEKAIKDLEKRYKVEFPSESDELIRALMAMIAADVKSTYPDLSLEDAKAEFQRRLKLETERLKLVEDLNRNPNFPYRAL